MAPDCRAASQDASAQGEGTATADRPASRDKGTHGFLWAADGPFVRPVAVRVGLSDGIKTEVAGEDLAEGMSIAIGVQTETSSQGELTTPFTPKIPKRERAMGPPPPM